MTFQTALEAGPGVHGLDAVLVIDGIPVAFGTRSGLTFDRNGDGWLNASPVSLTTVEAIATEGARVEGSKLDHGMLMVEGGGFACTLRSDTRWDKYFERRRTPRTRLNAALTPVATTLTLQSSAGWTAGDVAFVDREAILVGTVGTNQFTGCTRLHAALPGQMLTAHTLRANVCAAPPSLLKRVAELWLHLAGNWRLERRLVLESVSWDGVLKAWRTSFKDAIHVIDRPIAVGMDGIPVTTVAVSATTDGTPRQALITLGMGGGFGGLPAATSQGLCALVAVNDGTNAESFFAEVADIDPVAGDIVILSDLAERFRALLGNTSIATAVTGARGIEGQVAQGTVMVRLMYRLNGKPSVDALRVLLSTTGNGDNSGTYDDLFGNGTSGVSATPEDYAVDRRFGAGLSAAIVDVAGIAAFNDLDGVGWNYLLGVSGQENLRDFLEEVARQLQAYWLFENGKLTLRPMSGIGEQATIAATLTDAHISVDGNMDAVDDEEEALHTLSVKCNVDPLDGEPKGTVNIRDARSYEVWRDAAPAEEVTMRGLVVARPQRGYMPAQFGVLPAEYVTLVSRFSRVLHRRQRGLRRYSLTLPTRFLMLKPGDVVRVTCEALKAFDGGSLDADVFEVTSTSGFDLADPSKITIEITDTWAAKPTSPTAKVSSWSAGPPQVFTLTTSHRFGGSTTPGRQYAVGWKVRVFDASATPPFSTASGVLTVSAVTDTTVAVTGVVGFTPASGDLLVQANYDDANSTAENTTGVDQRGHAFAADTNGRLGTGDTGADTWG